MTASATVVHLDEHGQLPVSKPVSHTTNLGDEPAQDAAGPDPAPHLPQLKREPPTPDPPVTPTDSSPAQPTTTDSTSTSTASGSIRQKSPSRPPSRPPSLSRPPSAYRPRSASSVSRLSASAGAGGSPGPGTITSHSHHHHHQSTDSKRLSVSSSTGGGPVSPGGGDGHRRSSSSGGGGAAPASPSLASSSGVPVSPRIPEDAAVSPASIDETTPSPGGAKEPPASSYLAAAAKAQSSTTDADPAEGTQRLRQDSSTLAPEDRVAGWESAAAAAPPPASDLSSSTEETETLVVVVRDYAFPREDPRFEGKMLPEEIEAAEQRRRFRNDSSQLAAGFGGGQWMVDQEGMGPSPGGGGGAAGSNFHWGFVTSHASDFPGSELDDEDDEDEFTSAASHRGYAFHDPALGGGGVGFGDYVDEVGDGLGGGGGEGAEEDGDEEEEELGEFVPGVYSAVYAFEPELDTEMRLVEGDLVNVFERQCRGWVQAGRIVDDVLTEEVGLVPENYLALVEPHEGVVDWSTTYDGGGGESDDLAIPVQTSSGLTDAVVADHKPETAAAVAA
ncbi:hypothetical protein JCM3774_003904 [Rhodotorula dairenensis]